MESLFGMVNSFLDSEIGLRGRTVPGRNWTIKSEKTKGLSVYTIILVCLPDL